MRGGRRREGGSDHKGSAHKIPEADKPQICSWLAGGQLEGHQHPITPGRTRLSVLVRLATDWEVHPHWEVGVHLLTQSTSSHVHLIYIFTDTSSALVHLLLLQQNA